MPWKRNVGERSIQGPLSRAHEGLSATYRMGARVNRNSASGALYQYSRFGSPAAGQARRREITRLRKQYADKPGRHQELSILRTLGRASSGRNHLLGFLTYSAMYADVGRLGMHRGR